MNDLEKAYKQIAAALETAKQAYAESRKEYDAGRYEGLKEAVELLDRQLDRSLGR